MYPVPLILVFGIAFTSVPASQSGYRVVTTTATHSSLLSFNDEAWHDAHRISFGPSDYSTAFRALWSAEGLYVRFDASDRDPWHGYTERDDPLWDEEVVEIFLDPSRAGTDYAEVEISPANVVCDVRVLTGEPKKKIDVTWDLEGLESLTRMNRSPNGSIVGWTAIVFLPWTGFQSLPSITEVSLPPKPGERWRFNVFRIERPGGKTDPQRGAVLAAWSPPPGRSFHVPEAFRDLLFSKD